VWQAFLDPASSCTYFFNSTTGDTCWEAPEEVVAYLSESGVAFQEGIHGDGAFGSNVGGESGNDLSGGQGWLGGMEGGVSEGEEGEVYYDVDDVPYDPTADPNYIGEGQGLQFALCTRWVEGAGPCSLDSKLDCLTVSAVPC
jgi:hypothetical protein